MDRMNYENGPANPEEPQDHTEDILTRTSDVEHVQAEIAQTRTSMGETLSAIQEKLDPHAMMDHARETVHNMVHDIGDQARQTARGAVDEVKDAVGGAMHTAIDTTKKAGTTVMDTVNKNPGTTLILLGAGWWLLRSRRHSQGTSESLLETAMHNPIPTALLVGAAVHLARHHEEENGGRSFTEYAESAKTTVGNAGEAIGNTLHQAGDKASGVMEGAKGAIGGAMDSVKEKVGGAAHAVQETAGKARTSAGEMMGAAGEKARQAQNSLSGAVQANPLAAGAIALGVGAAIAMLLPDTEPENRMMGKTRDRLMESAQQSAGQLLDKVQNVSNKAIDAVADVARQEAQSLPPMPASNNLAASI